MNAYRYFSLNSPLGSIYLHGIIIASNKEDAEEIFYQRFPTVKESTLPRPPIFSEPIELNQQGFLLDFELFDNHILSLKTDQSTSNHYHAMTFPTGTYESHLQTRHVDHEQDHQQWVSYMRRELAKEDNRKKE